MANRKSQLAGARKAHHGGTEIAETMPQFANERGLGSTLRALCASVVKDSQATHAEFDLRHDQRMANYAKQSQLARAGLRQTKPSRPGIAWEPTARRAKQSQSRPAEIGAKWFSERGLCQRLWVGASGKQSQFAGRPPGPVGRACERKPIRGIEIASPAFAGAGLLRFSQ